MKLYYQEGYRFRLTRLWQIQTSITGYEGGNEFVHIDRHGLLTVQPAYNWDGASGPTVDTKSTRRASCAHDCLYQLIRLGVLPATNGTVQRQADDLLKRLMDEDSPQRPGVFGWVAERWNDFRGRYWWRGVRLFGESSTRPSAERPELVAP